MERGKHSWKDASVTSRTGEVSQEPELHCHNPCSQGWDRKPWETWTFSPVRAVNHWNTAQRGCGVSSTTYIENPSGYCPESWTWWLGWTNGLHKRPPASTTPWLWPSAHVLFNFMSIIKPLLITISLVVYRFWIDFNRMIKHPRFQ